MNVSFTTAGRSLRNVVAALLTVSVIFGGMPAMAAEPERTDYIISVDDAARASVLANLASMNVTPSDTFTEAFTGFTASLTDNEAAALATVPGVQHLEKITLKAKAVDSQENPYWNLDRLDQNASVDNGTDGKQYWYPKSAGQGVRIYVVDTGVMAERTGFTGRVTDGFDATYQGFLDQKQGLATFNNYNSAGSATNDCSGHGTAVASVAAGTVTGVAKKATIVPVRVLNCDGLGTNADIIRGIEWIMANHQAGTPAVINLSFGYVDKDYTYTCDPNFPKECNYPTLVEQTIASAVDAGFFISVAAGNDSEPTSTSLKNPGVTTTVVDACDFTPARVPGVFTVGATAGGYDGTPERRASFSNAGQCIDGFAPGTDIRTVYRVSDDILALSRGTSVAAPHVAGMAALMLAENPGLTNTQITAQLKSSAVTDALANTSTYPLNANTQYSTGTTLVNGTYLRYTTVNSVSPNLIIRSPFSPPARAAAVTDVALVTRSSSTLAISFTAPSNAVAAGVTHYRVTAKNVTANTTTTTTLSATKADGSAVTSTTLTGLDTNTPYQITVTALADGYVGVASTTLDATTDLVYSAPNAPSNAPSLLPGDASQANPESNIWVTWGNPAAGATAATGNSPITGSVVRYSADGQTWTETSILPISATAYQSIVLSGLTRATAYQVQYAWVNIYGQSGWSPVATTTTAAVQASGPLAVRRVSATGSTMNLAWDAPADNGGYPVTDYQIRYAATGASTSCVGVTWTTVTVGSAERSFTLTGLTARTNYCVYVKAYTQFGWGSLSSVLKTATLVDPTSAPTGLTASAGIDQVTIGWSAPASNGGQAAWDYMLEISLDNGSTWIVIPDSVTAATSVTITGLTFKTDYQVRVSARNDGGLSAASAPVSFTTLDAPALTAPSNVTISKVTKTGLTLSWTDPNTGAAAASVNGYTIFASVSGGTFQKVQTVSGATTAAVTGLLSGSTYTFVVVANSVYGTTSQNSDPVEATTLTGFASAPRNVAFSAVTKTTAVVSWLIPTSDGGDTITGYYVSLSTNNGQTWSTTLVPLANLTSSLNGTMLSTTVTGLTTGETYTVKVNASNISGPGAASDSASALIATVPNAPAVTVASRTAYTATLSWTAPAANGAAVTGYRVLHLVNGTWTTLATVDAATTTYTVTDLVRATGYTFRVIAINSVGDSIAGETSTTTLAVAPNAVTTWTVTSTATSISISWTAPADNGGSAITGYIVEYKKSSDETWTAASAGSTSYTINALAKGTTYQVRVLAVNGIGSTASADQSIATKTTVPGAVTAVSSTVTSNSATVTWTAPADNGGTAITGYTVEYKKSTDVTWTLSDTVDAASTSHTVTGLTRATAYLVRVTAVNATGSSATAVTVATTPAVAPDAPTNVTSIVSATVVDLTWDAPADNGGSSISDYTVTYAKAGAMTSSTLTVSGTSTRISGLAKNTEYEFSIVAVNSVGSSAAAAVTAKTNTTAPDAVAALTASVDTTEATVSWVAPADNGGSAITGYTVEYKKATDITWTTITVDADTTSMTIGNLAKGTTYQVRVTATNPAGTSAATSRTVTTQASAPAAVADVTATANGTGLAVTWTAPADNGGSAITGYTVEYTISGETSWSTTTVTDTTAILNGLRKGVTYLVRVTAHNEAGASDKTAAEATTATTVPGAPAALTATAAATGLTVTWTAPADNGGTAITGYTVEYKKNGATDWTSRDVAADITSQEITGLDKGSVYLVRVTAFNSNGAGSATTASPRTLTTLAGKVGNATGTAGIADVTAGSTITVTWTAPADNGGNSISGYRVSYRTTGQGAWVTIDTVEPTLTVTKAKNAQAYEFTIQALTVDGAGAVETVEVTTDAAAPGQVTALDATRVNGTATVTWKAPVDNGGSDITGYVVKVRVTNGTTWIEVPTTGTATSATITGLTVGTTYVVAVTATNEAGEGTAVTVMTNAGYATASAPLNLTGTKTTSSTTVTTVGVTLSWNTPSNTGGAAITDYLIEYRKTGATAWTVFAHTASAAQARTVHGLAKGTSYDFRVRAVNSVGEGAIAQVNGIVTDADASTVVRNLIVSKRTRNVIGLSWNAPANNGGSPIVDYIIKYKKASASTWITFKDTKSTATAVALAGLSANTSYNVRVYAVNAVGKTSSYTPMTASTTR